MEIPDPPDNKDREPAVFANRLIVPENFTMPITQVTALYNDAIRDIPMCTPTFAVDLQFPPYIDANKIGLNLGRLSDLCKVGGINRIVICNSDKDDDTKESPMILGHDNQGNAFGGFVGTTAPKYDVEVNGLSERYRKEYQIADVKIPINTQKMSERIAKTKAKGSRDLGEWANAIDEQVRSTLTQAGKKHLLRTNQPSLNNGIVNQLFALLIFRSIYSAYPHLTSLVFAQIVTKFIDYITTNHQIRRNSALTFFGYEFDRYLVFTQRLKTRGLITEILPKLDQENDKPKA